MTTIIFFLSFELSSLFLKGETFLGYISKHKCNSRVSKSLVSFALLLVLFMICLYLPCVCLSWTDVLSISRWLTTAVSLLYLFRGLIVRLRVNVSYCWSISATMISTEITDNIIHSNVCMRTQCINNPFKSNPKPCLEIDANVEKNMGRGAKSQRDTSSKEFQDLGFK